MHFTETPLPDLYTRIGILQQLIEETAAEIERRRPPFVDETAALPDEVEEGTFPAEEVLPEEFKLDPVPADHFTAEEVSAIVAREIARQREARETYPEPEVQTLPVRPNTFGKLVYK